MLVGSVLLIALSAFGVFSFQTRRSTPPEQPQPLPQGAQAESASIRSAGEQGSHNSAGKVAAHAKLSADPSSVVGELEDIIVLSGPVSEARFIVRLDQVTADEAPFAFDVLKNATEGGRATNAMWQTLWMRWGAVDLEAALAQADEGVPSYGQVDRLRKHIFEGLGKVDPQAAAEYILAHPELPDRHRAVEGLSVQWALKDPDAATRWALSELEGPDLGHAMHAIPWGITEMLGRGSALEWWDSLPTDEARGHAYVSLSEIYRSAGGGPAGLEAQISLAWRSIGHGIRDAPLLSGIGFALGQTDPNRGIEIFTSAPPGDGSAYYAGLDALVLSWSQQDPAEAGEWLSRRLDEPWTDTAILGYVRGTVGTDPEAAAIWAAAIRDETLSATCQDVVAKGATGE